jgi:predicted HAD superfamily Cof-like phosphohydrolase
MTTRECSRESLFDMVAQFQEKFGQIYDGPPRLLEMNELLFKLSHLDEELEELSVAHSDLEGQFDALIDTVYVSLGMAYRMGLPFDEGFRRVHEANMKKELASAENPGKRGNPLDIVKPVGWEPASLEDLCK